MRAEGRKREDGGRDARRAYEFPCRLYPALDLRLPDARGLGSFLGDDLPTGARLAQGAEVDRLIAELKLRGGDRLAGLKSGVHRGVEGAGDQQRPLDRIRRP